MAGIVKIVLVIGGEGAVTRAFKTILQAAQASGKEQIKIARETSRAVAKAANENANPKVAAANYAKELREQKRANDQKLAEARRGNARIEAENKRAEKQKEARDNAAINRSVQRTIREAELRERAEKRAEDKRAAIRKLEERKGQRIAYAMDFAKGDEINRRRAGVRGALGDAIKRGGSTGVGLIQAGAGMVGGYLGTQTVLDAGRAQLDLGRRQALLQNATGDNATDFVGLSKSVSNAVGEDAGSVMGGLEEIAGKAGAEGIAQAKDQMLELAKVAKGAGVSMEDLGDVTATLLNRGIKSGDLVKNIEALVQQGKDGAVEFKDLATLLDASSGALIKFKMDSTGRSMSAGGLSQIARTYGKSSAAESTNAVVDLARDLGGKADDIKKLTGVEVGVGGKVGRAQLRDVNALLPEIIEGIVKKGNAGKLEGQGGIFTGNSTTISTPLMQAFTLGLKKNESGRLQIAGEGEAADIKGKEAVKALLSQFEDTLPKAGASVEAFNRLMATQSEQTNVAMNKLKNDLGEKLTPVIAKASPQIIKLITAFGELTAWALTNPFKAIGGIILASIAQSLLGAGLSSLTDKLLGKAIPTLNVTAGNVNMTGGAGASGVLGSGMNGYQVIGGIIGGAIVAYMASQAITGQLDEERKQKGESAVDGLNLAAAVGSGKASDAEVQRAAMLWGEQKEDQQRGVVGRFLNETARPAVNLVTGEGGGVGNVANWARTVIPGAAAYSGAAAVASDDTRGAQGQSVAALEEAFARANKSEAMLAAMGRIAATNEQVAAAVANGGLQGPKVIP